MKMRKRTVLFLFLAVACNPGVRVSAGDSKEVSDSPSAESAKPKRKLHPAAYFALIEGIALVNSAMAIPRPRAYGIATAILFPFGAMNGGPGPNRAEDITALVSLEGVAAMNIFALDHHRESAGEIFLANFTAMNAAFALTKLAGVAFPDSKSLTASGYILPRSREGQIIVSYHF